VSPDTASLLRRIFVVVVVLGSIRACTRLAADDDAGRDAPDPVAARVTEVPRTVALDPDADSGSFGVTCLFSHRLADDPIVVPGVSGGSHLHDFFGAVGVNARTRWVELPAMDTTCDNHGDWSSYWVPTLLAPEGPVDPHSMAVYLRTPPLSGDPDLVAPPNGLEMISVRGGWTCGRDDQPLVHPRDCPASALTRLVLEFPDCWDGEHLRAPADGSHLVASINGECPAAHPQRLPLMVVEVRWELEGRPAADLSLSSGGHHAHGDILFAWDQDVLRGEMDACLVRRVVCDLTWTSFVGA
jgi:hypothetical protein